MMIQLSDMSISGGDVTRVVAGEIRNLYAAKYFFDRKSQAGTEVHFT